MPGNSDSEKPLPGLFFRSPPSAAGAPLSSLDGHNNNPPLIGNTSPVGPSSNLPLDNLFNFQIVVFQVEGTLFQVLKNGFNVPGTTFEAMFALPVHTPNSTNSNNHTMEGSTRENPIHLPGVTAKDFRAFLRVLYPFMGPSLPFTYDDWVGILNLSTMWEFKEYRAKAISKLSILITEKSATERISLGRTYRVASWLRDEYIRLTQKRELRMEELHDSSAISLDWETIAKLLSVREKNLLRQVKYGLASDIIECYHCSTKYGWDPSMEFIDCPCYLPSVIDSVFGDELNAMKDPDYFPPVGPTTSRKKYKWKKRR